jgi:hypothetical protein
MNTETNTTENIYHFEDWVTYMLDHSDYEERHQNFLDFEEHYQNLLDFQTNADLFIKWLKPTPFDNLKEAIKKAEMSHNDRFDILSALIDYITSK